MFHRVVKMYYLDELFDCGVFFIESAKKKKTQNGR